MVDEIIARNLKSGRAGKVSRQWRSETSPPDPEPTTEQLRRYRDRVETIYRHMHEFIEALHRGDDESWRQLWEQLHNTAYSMLLRLGRDNAEATDLASEFVQQTCETVYYSQFPYDVSFDAWINTILRNHILQRFTRSREFLDRRLHIGSLDEMQEMGDHTMPALGSHPEGGQLSPPDFFTQMENRMALLDALEQLSSQARQEVILYTYFYGWEDEEIAIHLNKTKNAVHALRHRALKQLRGLLDDPSPD